MNLGDLWQKGSGEGRSIGIMTALNLGSGVVAVANWLLLANLFGTSRAIEIYFAATTLVRAVEGFTQSGHLSGIFLPVYQRLKVEQGRATAFGALSVTLTWMVLGTLGLCAALWLLAPYVVGLLVPGFDVASQVETISVFRCLVPLVGVVGFRSFLQAQAYAEGRFGGPESLAVAERVVAIVVLLMLVWRLGLWALVIAYWVSQVTSLAGYFWLARRTGYRYTPKLRQSGFRPWQAVFNKMPHTMSYMGSGIFVSFVITAGLSMLPPGLLALYKYVEGIYSKLSPILLRPVSLVYFTNVSTEIARGGRRLREHAHIALGRYLLLWAGLFSVVLTSSHPMLLALWGTEKFSAAEVGLAARLLEFLFLLLFVQMLMWVLEKANLAMQDGKRLFGAKTVVQLITAAAAWFLIPAFGVVGAVGTLAVRICGFALASGLLIWLKERLIIFHPVDRLWRWAVAVMMGGATGAGLATAFGAPIGPDARLIVLGQAIVLSGVTALVTYGAAWGLQVPELRSVARGLHRIRSRFSPSPGPG